MIRDRIVSFERVKARDLKANPSNWRTHPRMQSGVLKGVLADVGYADALIARRVGEELILIDGHLRKSLDPDQTVPVLVVDLDADEADRLLAVLDPIAGLAGADPGALSALLDRIQTTDEAIEDLLERLRRSLPAERKPRPGHDLAEAKVGTGELWRIGEHLLACKDSREPAAFAGLGSFDLMITDPPYGVDYVGKTLDALRIPGDRPSELAQLLDAVFANAANVLKPGAPVYVFAPSGKQLVEFLGAFSRHFSLRQILVWAKGRIVLGHGDYHYAHELVIYGNAAGKRRRRGGLGWYGGDAKSSVLTYPSPLASPDHPTPKPVELVKELISNSSRRNARVLDPFAGSGSTLVAAAQSNRSSAGIELSARYASVALSRLQEETGQAASHG